MSTATQHSIPLQYSVPLHVRIPDDIEEETDGQPGRNEGVLKIICFRLKQAFMKRLKNATHCLQLLPLVLLDNLPQEHNSEKIEESKTNL